MSIPFGKGNGSRNLSKTSNKICDNSVNNVVRRRSSNINKQQMGENLIDLDNGIEDTT